ncbi:MAG: transcriptional regulator, LacI family [Thermomicrobiales bacterium]|nr:transcriptional regulator, LacI family [Thermomicrobiales bacterium]
MTPSTRVEKSRGRAVEKETKAPRLHDSTTPPLLEDRAVTIQDVAARSGVSISTVSRVVTGAVAVEPETAERVREAIAALGYRPNLLARSFRRRVTHTIGLLVPDNSTPFFAELARTIEDAGFADGYSVVLCNSDLSAVKQETYIDVLLANRVDGLILVSSGLIPTVGRHDAVARILDAGAPCVVVDRDLGETPVDQVLVDNDQGGYLAGEHLIALGHRRIACLVGPSDLTPSAGRIAGFQRALADAGLAVAAEGLVRGNGRPDGGSAAALQLLERGVVGAGDVTAIFAFNDQMATGAIGALQRAGCRVPQDVSVIGFDDIPQSAAIFPALTTIAQPIAEMGSIGVRLLLDRIARRDAPHQRVRLSTRLVVRESTGPPGESGRKWQDGP